MRWNQVDWFSLVLFFLNCITRDKPCHKSCSFMLCRSVKQKHLSQCLDEQNFKNLNHLRGCTKGYIYLHTCIVRVSDGQAGLATLGLVRRGVAQPRWFPRNVVTASVAQVKPSTEISIDAHFCIEPRRLRFAACVKSRTLEKGFLFCFLPSRVGASLSYVQLPCLHHCKSGNEMGIHFAAWHNMKASQ